MSKFTARDIANMLDDILEGDYHDNVEQADWPMDFMVVYEKKLSTYERGSVLVAVCGEDGTQEVWRFRLEPAEGEEPPDYVKQKHEEVLNR